MSNPPRLIPFNSFVGERDCIEHVPFKYSPWHKEEPGLLQKVSFSGTQRDPGVCREATIGNQKKLVKRIDKRITSRRTTRTFDDASDVHPGLADTMVLFMFASTGRSTVK